ncbi:serine--tRNA ligase [Candidatus Falkowbacteria bacterium]|nr:serine--tRNA ligase [Candidatus Falkowbacteria bacterium]
MMDIKFVRENVELMKKVAKNKNSKVDIDKLLVIDDKRRSLISEVEKLKSELNKRSKTKPGPEEIAALKELGGKIKEMDAKLATVEKEYRDLMLLVPNVYADDTPVGPDDSANREISRWGEPTKFDFKPKDHIILGKDLDILDLDAGAKTSGYRGYYLKNEAVLLHFALLWHAINKMKKKGFELMVTPTLLREFALVGSGHFPEGKDEIYQIGNPGRLADGSTKETTYLAGTSEPALLAYFADKTLNEEDLPIKVCGFSECYRSEIGSYGKDMKGIYRIHEFMKVEQVILCKNNLRESLEWLERLREIAEEILRDLKLPYRVVQLSTGDMGTGKYKMYDLETHMPSMASRHFYGETHSDSNLTDWQARRLNIKYKNKDGKTEFVYTLNNTVIASPRILIAILENYQQKDGSVKIPKVLQKYCGVKVIKKK